VVTVAGEVLVEMLTASLRLERGDAGRQSFLLEVSLHALPGITILFGPSGAGKSTLLDCIAGLTKPDWGRIVSGEEVLFDSDRGVNLPPQNRRIGYVFQSSALFPHLSVEKNIAYGLTHFPQEQQSERVTEILQAFRIEDLRTRKPEEVSGGEKQRTALARSLVTLPHVLLLDEPLTGLDAELKDSIVEDLRAWNSAQKIPILYVTHSRDEVDALGERVVALERGRIISEGTPGEVLNAPRRRRLAQAAGFENFLNAIVLDLREADGVMRVRLAQSSSEIEIPLGYASPGDHVRIAIRAGDILLATERPRGLSARNVLEGKILSLEQRGAMVIARVDCGVALNVHVTPGATRALELGVGKPISIVLKTHSCHLVDD